MDMAYTLERAIFIKVGWMNYYGFLSEDGGPAGGGEANAADVAEGANFKEIKGRAYGLVNVTLTHIGRLGAAPGSSTQNGVLVVAVASRPDGTGQVVVGWQGRAMLRQRRKELGDADRLYNYEAKIENSVLLPEDARTWKIPSEGMGTAKLAYGCTESGRPLKWAADLLQEIEKYEEDGGENLLSAAGD